MFSSEFCEISKNTFFYLTPPVAASVICSHSIVKTDDFYNSTQRRIYKQVEHVRWIFFAKIVIPEVVFPRVVL